LILNNFIFKNRDLNKCVSLKIKPLAKKVEHCDKSVQLLIRGILPLVAIYDPAGLIPDFG
jgi:hypothetical protein